MAKIVRFFQEISLDPTCSHSWMKATIVEYAITEQKIVFNYQGNQINIIDGVYYSSRFSKGRNKLEVEVPNLLVQAVIELRDARQIAIRELAKIEPFDSSIQSNGDKKP